MRKLIVLAAFALVIALPGLSAAAGDSARGNFDYFGTTVHFGSRGTPTAASGRIAVSVDPGTMLPDGTFFADGGSVRGKVDCLRTITTDFGGGFVEEVAVMSGPVTDCTGCPSQPSTFTLVALDTGRRSPINDRWDLRFDQLDPCPTSAYAVFQINRGAITVTDVSP
jgi:hypothetical protein